MEHRRAEAPKPVPVLVEAVPKPVPSLAQRQRETAEYLADMILELRNLARSVQLHTVMVPLEFAYYEAFGAAHKVEVPPGEAERIRELSRTAEAFDGDPGNTGL
ncbi:hypothetical protein DK847_10675 [Aestuariivirga litoralis]|uniref:Uncharacterized protein n=1 Tax=Aestuariivirga litoralis TaxID=2650924 RepID=A0A2W2BTX2_9HYPH|nr:hypothetical protein [Aestuariivirga litoralis]PZF76916.1 hypothetical protein DK847_10675 [Aestuariivirga litoralis]